MGNPMSFADPSAVAGMGRSGRELLVKAQDLVWSMQVGRGKFLEREDLDSTAAATPRPAVRETIIPVQATT